MFYFDTRCIQKFIDVKCLKDNDENSDSESDEDVQAEVLLTAWRNEYKKDFDISLLDEDKMMAHMMDCFSALCAAQQYRVKKKQLSKLNAKTQQAKNKVFKTAMSLISTVMTHDGNEASEFCHAFSKMVSKFPGDDTKQTDGRGWMPLHWAAIAFDTPEGNLHGLTEEDVHLVCANDPLALQRYHHQENDDHYINVQDQDNEADCAEIQRYTPMHFLCMQPVTAKRMSLLQYFSISNRQALFIPSVLHVTCQLGQPTEELLKLLVQLDSSQTAKFYCGDNGSATPLGHLCYNSCCNERLMKCLLDVDSSAKVVVNGLNSCMWSSDHANLLEKFDFLLKYHDFSVLQEFHEGCFNQLMWGCCVNSKLPLSLRISIMRRLVAIHRDVVKEEYEGKLPIHYAASDCCVEVLEFLLGLYPESAMITSFESWNGTGANLLHLALMSSDISSRSAKVGYLCARYPEMIHQRNGLGNTPFHLALAYPQQDVLNAQLLCEIGGQELARMPVIHLTDSVYYNNGWLPLHSFVSNSPFYSLLDHSSSPLSETADFFRSMLRWYPEAAGIEAGNGKDKKTPYQLAVDGKLDPYYLRLLLRAAPTHNPAELHRLNYAERRMAMFIAFRAATSNPTPLLMARLLFENKDLVKHVVSFL